MTELNVLVIDDDLYVQNFLRDALEALNYQVTIAGNGKEGLSHFKEIQYDLVLLDMQLPDISGKDVLKKIKTISSTTIVIMITGHGSIQNAVESMRLGAYNYLSKPISLKTLKAELKQAEDNRRLLLENRYPIETISFNGVQGDPGFIKF